MDPALAQLDVVRAASIRHVAAVRHASAAEQGGDGTTREAALTALDDASDVLETEALKLLSSGRPTTAAGKAELLMYASSREGADALPDLTEDGKNFTRALMSVCAAAIQRDASAEY